MHGRGSFQGIQNSQPFARGQEKAVFITGPYLGGFIYVLTTAVAAAGTVTVAPGFTPRTVFVKAVPAGFYPSRVQQSAGPNWGPRNAVVIFESVQPVGTALFFE